MTQRLLPLLLLVLLPALAFGETADQEPPSVAAPELGSETTSRERQCPARTVVSEQPEGAFRADCTADCWNGSQVTCSGSWCEAFDSYCTSEDGHCESDLEYKDCASCPNYDDCSYVDGSSCSEVCEPCIKNGLPYNCPCFKGRCDCY